MKHGVNDQLSALTISLHSAALQPSERVELFSYQDLPAAADDVPEWIHLLPAGQLRTVDGRGPYQVGDVTALMARSMAIGGGRLVVDENHATDIAARHGGASPARGWIVELEERPNGVWGKVEWTKSGRELMADRAYRGISPAIAHDRTNRVGAILRASLVNRPNLVGLVTLHHQEKNMDLLARLLAALGLPTETSEDTLITAVTTLHQAQSAQTVSLQSQIDPIAVAAGLQAGASAADITAAVATLAAEPDSAVIVSLQSELAEVTTKLNDLVDNNARKAAEGFVDGAIARKVVGVSPLRDHYITRHMADPAAVEREIGALPSLGNANTIVPPRSGAGGELSATDSQVISLMGLDPEAFKKIRKSEQEAAL
ncbi:phage protease [Paradevosia shaoguanensis]|uniref:Phage protease n=1 Tax=Paradevosia shaoguanensis TaxID=1335043 RepID=A0AA41QQE8_9HYPH|nr:phage protease [Paradevosia shaoguanensis]MCF1744629.1 phage protease [Paradevosia shaoguanensis]MCI0129112.1 phage protease [Paradevosia shaoguanensis]